MARTKKRQPLDRERILEATQDLIAAKGLEGWSMRGLAAELGVEPMSLYHWFPSRAHVLDGLVERFARALVIPTEGSWKERLRAASHSFRRAAMLHPAFFPYLSIHRFNALETLGILEGLLGILAEEFPDPAARAVAFRLWVHWMIGFLLDSTAGFAKGPGAVDPPDDATVAEQFPLVTALGPYNRPEHFDLLFEAGLEAILEAIERLPR